MRIRRMRRPAISILTALLATYAFSLWAQNSPGRLDVVLDDTDNSSPDSGLDGGIADAGLTIIDTSAEVAVAEPESSDAGLLDASLSADTPPPSTTPVSEKKSSWRKDPNQERRPSSYIGGGMAYAQSRSWYTSQEDEFKDDISAGPLNSMSMFLRFGDAFYEWLAVGFQINIVSGSSKDSSSAISAFGLLLDVGFTPWKGLILRPSVGLGFGYSSGDEEFEFGYGSPAFLAFTTGYEFRVSRFFCISPIAQISYLGGDDYNSMFLVFGIEMTKYFIKKSAD
jgi:hypothetical protein